MTTKVTVRNDGPYEINVNEVELVSPMSSGEEKLIESHTLKVGDEISLNIWGARRYLCILETAP